ncbi:MULTISPECIES: M48 family metalloprotease [Tritonibacter]|uniref:M48 family metalloprotease n=1 Tax=Tritonibacter scottomollicae TaxID=483013 RepID=A0A2T1AK39_TRISK|nr:M48 family metalloprotease [Tritonibacter scottomollicae]PRZ48969.1 peptidase M48-like protein [Tritonibacter scottomollicae]WOI34888.1 M48 family metalloprotease [Tritonibacter scottomollicae]
MRRFLILIVLWVAGCAGITADDPTYRAFVAVAQDVEPVAEAECRKRNPNRNCDFELQLDMDPKAPANAFQSVDRSGRPLVIFTASMLESFRNPDEMAFVMSHEVAHHILGHLDQQRRNAVQGAVFLGELVSLEGGTPEEIANAQYVGAVVGARSYSKAFELEADALGTVITHLAGYRPSIGVQFFDAIPDPGDAFLGTHPANPDRILVVKKTIRKYGLN